VEKYTSKLLNNAVAHFENLPGIGKRTALRLVLFLLRQDKSIVEQFGSTLSKLHDDIIFCKKCHNISDQEVCNICSNFSRQKNSICIVENLQDVIAVEQTNQYKGLYHILGGIISPMDGIGPNDLNIETLIDRITNDEIKEVIFALSTTMEGDTTAFYIFKKIKDLDVNISTIARGISIGGELEYADEATLGNAISKRVPYELSINN